MTGFVIIRLLIAIKVPTKTERRPPKLDGLLGWQISDSCDRQYLLMGLGPMPAYIMVCGLSDTLPCMIQT